MPRIHTVNKKTMHELNKLIILESEYQSIKFKSSDALILSIEYLFLEGYKLWENFLEDFFLSAARYNDPVSGKRAFPFLNPKTESHALDLMKQEKPYLDWTSPETIITRAEICFRNHKIITDPIKMAMQDLRDARKLRNTIAHRSKESVRIFKELSRIRIGSLEKRPGYFLIRTSPDNVNTYIVYYLELFKLLVEQISN